MNKSSLEALGMGYFFNIISWNLLLRFPTLAAINCPPRNPPFVIISIFTEFLMRLNITLFSALPANNHYFSRFGRLCVCESTRFFMLGSWYCVMRYAVTVMQLAWRHDCACVHGCELGYHASQQVDSLCLFGPVAKSAPHWKSLDPLDNMHWLGNDNNARHHNQIVIWRNLSFSSPPLKKLISKEMAKHFNANCCPQFVATLNQIFSVKLHHQNKLARQDIW